MNRALLVTGLALLGGGLAAYYEHSRRKTKTQELAQEAIGPASTYVAAGAGALAGAALGFVVSAATASASA